MKVSSRRVLSLVLALNGVIAAPLNPRNVEVVTVTEVTTEVVHYTSTRWVGPAHATGPAYGPDPDDDEEDHRDSNNDIPSTSSVSMPETLAMPSVSTSTSDLSVVPSSTLAYSSVETTQQTTTSTPTTTPTTTPTKTPASPTTTPTTTPTPTTPPPPPTTPLTTPTTTTTSTSPPPPPAVKVPTTEVPTTTPPVYVPMTTPPVVPTTTAAPPPTSSTPPTYGGDGGSSESFVGQGTFFAPGLGSCGINNGNDDLIVAISRILMSSVKIADPNKNPFCKRKIICTYNDGPPVTVTVTDTCPECEKNNLDFSPSAFAAMGAPESAGRVPIKWHWAS